MPLGGAWVSASYYYSDSKHVHAATGLSSGATFSYDANGNMIERSEGGRVYTQTFDAENRLVSVAQAGVGTTQYIYDGDGQLTKQVNPGGTGRLYLGVVEYELNTNGTTAGSTSYYAVPGARAVRTSAGLFYVLTDHLGSASVSLDSGGAVVAEMRYDAFGATRLSVGSMPGDRLYTAQVWQQGIGLYYFNARWYDPYLNRLSSADTIMPEPGNPQALNRYAFALGNPLKYTDPSGHFVCSSTLQTGMIFQPDCTSWIEQVLSDLENSGQAGLDLAKFMRDLDAQLDGQFMIFFYPGGAGIAPPMLNYVFIPESMYLTTPGTTSWYDNLGLISHEFAHHMTSGGRDRITTRSEAAAYQIEGKIENDLAPLRTNQRGARDAAALALTIDLDDWAQLERFRTYLREWAKADPLSAYIYGHEPVWGVAADRLRRAISIYGTPINFLPGAEFQ